MDRLIVCVIFLQFSLINAYVDFTNDFPRWCRSDVDCQNPFVKCMYQGRWDPPVPMAKGPDSWGQCRIPWDFGTECNTDLDCVRGSTCDALYCHGPSTRGPDPVLRKGLKKYAFFTLKRLFNPMIFRYCHCTTPPEAMRNGAKVDDLMVVSDPSQPANLMGKRRRRSLKRRKEELLTMIKT